MLASSRQTLPSAAPSRKAPKAHGLQVHACLQCTIAKRKLIDLPHLGTTAKHASPSLERCSSTTSLKQPSSRPPTAPAALSKEDASQTDGAESAKDQPLPTSTPSSASTPSSSRDASAEQEDSLPVRYALHTSCFHPTQATQGSVLMAYLCRLALQLLQFYRSGISPMMAPSCRYLPSCSEYSIQSYKRFGKATY
jgi:hypothetical protein